MTQQYIKLCDRSREKELLEGGSVGFRWPYFLKDSTIDLRVVV